MGFVAWLVLGLIAGFIASKLVNKTGEGVAMDIVLGIVGIFVPFLWLIGAILPARHGSRYEVQQAAQYQAQMGQMTS